MCKASIIIRKCCICNKFLGIKNGHGIWGVSHGYCNKCRDAELKKLGIEKSE